MKRTAHTALLLRALRMTEETYAHLLLEEGMRYLDLYMADDKEGRAVLMGMEEYWAWWNSAADRRNKQLVSEQHIATWAPSMDRWERAKLRELFEITHSAEVLEVTPPRHVMRPAIRAMRERVITNRKSC